MATSAARKIPKGSKLAYDKAIEFYAESRDKGTHEKLKQKVPKRKGVVKKVNAKGQARAYEIYRKLLLENLSLDKQQADERQRFAQRVVHLGALMGKLHPRLAARIKFTASALKGARSREIQERMEEYSKKQLAELVLEKEVLHFYIVEYATGMHSFEQQERKLKHQEKQLKAAQIVELLEGKTRKNLNAKKAA